MRWIVGDFEFDASRRLLRNATTETVLEPKASALLSFFCQNAHKDISRDELLESVWFGQIVSDNTVNRVIVLLRKALKDDEKSRRYIATIPKLGYRFIASVRSVDLADAERLPDTQTVDRKITKRAALWRVVTLGLVLLVALGISLLSPLQDQQADSGRSAIAVKPLSRLGVAQFNADLASDGLRLVYTAGTPGGNAVFLTSPSLATPVRVSAPGGDADFAKWASNDEFLMYLFLDGERCEFHRVDVNENAILKHQVVYQGIPNCYSEFSFSKDSTKLYFTERAGRFAPYVAFELDLISGNKRRLSQPVVTGMGNHFVDVHPGSGKLLLLSDHSPGRSTVYELDTEANSFTLRKSFEYSLQSAVWGHQSDTVVHASMHPSYQLVSTHLTSGDSDIIVSDSRRISSPRRISGKGAGGGDFLFTSYLYNRDIRVSHQPDVQVNSAVMDYLPSLSSDAQKLAFVSKRNGYSQIMIKDFSSKELVALEPNDRGRLYYSLRWSGDGLRILANTNSGVVVYDVQSAKRSHRIDFELPAYAVNWAGHQLLSYSHFEDGHWHAYQYDLETGESTSYDERWAFVLINSQIEIKVSQNFDTYVNGNQAESLAACAGPVWRYRLRFELDGSDIYCHSRESYTDLLKFDSELVKTSLPNQVERYEFFSVAAGHIAATSVVSASSDIMQTTTASER